MQPTSAGRDEAEFRGPHLRRRSRSRLFLFLNRSGAVAAGVTTAVVAGLIVYFSVHDGFRPKQRELADDGLRASASCAAESAGIGKLLASGEAGACQDFYAFVCDRGRGLSPVERRIVKKSKRIAEKKPAQKHLRKRQSTGATTAAAILYSSCLSFLASPTIPVEENIKAIPGALKLNVETAFGKLDTPLRILEALAFLSREGGLPSFVSLRRDQTGTLLLGVRRPLSAFLNDTAMADVFFAVAGALNITDDDTGRHVRDLLETDRDLKRNWDFSSSVETVSIEELADLGGNVTEQDWSKLSQDVPPVPFSQTPSAAKARGLNNVKLALTALFSRMDKTDVGIYLLSHVLLPEEMLAVLAPKQNASCLRLVRFVFGDAWYAMASEPSPVESVEALQELATVANTVSTVLKKNIAMSPLFVDPDDVAEAVDKITDLLVVAPSEMVVPYKVAGTMANLLRDRLDPRNLYKNLLEFRRYYAAAPSKHGPGFDDFRDSTLLFEGGINSNASVSLSRAALAPPFTCGDHFLNYAGLGAVVAQAMLEAVGGPFCVGRRHGLGECTGNSSVATARLDMVKECLTTHIKAFKSPPSLESGIEDSKPPLDALIASTAAFQVAMEAGHENYRADHPEAGLVFSVPREVDMTYVTRYCYHLCGRHLDENFPHGNPSLSARLQCNLAVMNAPMFAELFNCSQGDPMFAKRCVVL